MNWLMLLPILCLVACSARTLEQAIEIGPAAFIPPDHPALLAVQAEAKEEAALREILIDRTLSDP
jgi:hypothetical protein